MRLIGTILMTISRTQVAPYALRLTPYVSRLAIIAMSSVFLFTSAVRADEWDAWDDWDDDSWTEEVWEDEDWDDWWGDEYEAPAETVAAVTVATPVAEPAASVESAESGAPVAAAERTRGLASRVDTNDETPRRRVGPTRADGAATAARIGMMPGHVVARTAEGAIGVARAAPTRTTCTDRDNPFVIWEDKDACKIKECAELGDFVLYGKGTDNPQCLQACTIWGGTATRAWTGNDYGVCGSGDKIECDSGFVSVNNRTSASGMEFKHCIPVGARTGRCTNDGEMRVCDLRLVSGGQAQQFCENGYWSQCTVGRFCGSDRRESNRREVWTVIDRRDRRTSTFDCI